MKICLLLAGLKDSKATGLLRLKPYFEERDYKVYPLSYGWFIIRGLLWHPFNVPLARLIAIFTRILHECGVKIVLVAHSNGATIAAKASHLGARFDVLVFIDGAVSRDVKLGDQTGYLLNMRTATDPVLQISRVIAPLTPWADFSGSLGSTGVKANSDPRMLDFNLTEIWGIKFSHAGFVSAERVEKTGPWLVDVVEYHLRTSVEEVNQ